MTTILYLGVEQHPIDEIIAPFVYESNMNNKLFNLYLQTILLPLLVFGTVIIMDNAPYQMGRVVTKSIKDIKYRKL